ncbi:MAG: phenylacetate--CoA ligase family protein [Nevskiales bacterium]
MSYVVRWTRTRRRAPALREQAAFYSQPRTSAAIREWQLGRLNQIWQEAYVSSPHYAELKRVHALPERFSSLEEYALRMPILDRPALQREDARFGSIRRAADFSRITGGSTAEPVQIASWRSELRYSDLDYGLAREWFGVKPADRLFLLWGHAHLFGAGWRGTLNRWQRRLKDALLGYHRFSAYDLSPAAMQRAVAALNRFRPDAVIGYSTALEAMAESMLEAGVPLQPYKLKVVIATAEAFRLPDSARRISEAFGCRVAMEYGAVETGVIAHEHPKGGFRVFWRHHLLEGIPSTELPDTYELLITNLFPRCTPLLRYRLGDLVSENPSDPAFDQVFSRVIGRCNDHVQLADGRRIHSELFAHVLRQYPEFQQFQVVQRADGAVALHVVAPLQDGEALFGRLRENLARVHPELARIECRLVDSLPKTIAGKTRRVRREL